MAKNNQQTIVINGVEVKGDVSTLRSILFGVEASVVTDLKADKPKAPKAPRKSVKAEKPETEEPAKAEVPADQPEFKYTSGGAILQYADHNTLKACNLKRVNNAMDRLVKAGFCVSWKRVGGWIHISHSKKADGKTLEEWKDAVNLLTKGWEIHVGKGGAHIVDKNMLANYADSFRPEA